MEKNEIKINKNVLIEAYKNGDENVKNALEGIYGKELFKQKTVIERIKAFGDAVDELGTDHPLVKEYFGLKNFSEKTKIFLQLCIITAALNEEWKPIFWYKQRRFYPVFHFLFYIGGGFQFDKVYEVNAEDSTFDSKFYFKSRELAEYAGIQFCNYFCKFFSE